jgi:hypothetical protein
VTAALADMLTAAATALRAFAAAEPEPPAEPSGAGDAEPSGAGDGLVGDPPPVVQRIEIG